MTKPITARVHGVLDYVLVAAFLNAPMVFGSEHSVPATIVYWLAGIRFDLMIRAAPIFRSACSSGFHSRSTA